MHAVRSYDRSVTMYKFALEPPRYPVTSAYTPVMGFRTTKRLRGCSATQKHKKITIYTSIDRKNCSEHDDVNIFGVKSFVYYL